MFHKNNPRGITSAQTSLEHLMAIQQLNLSPQESIARIQQAPWLTTLEQWATENPAMLAVKANIVKLQAFNLGEQAKAPVLITGPSGTGKELLAKSLMTTDEPFVPVNCSTLPASLIDSLFFGYKRGAFTDAKEDRAGILEEAGNGVVFLDEVGDFPVEQQGKLLRAIQEREIYRLGEVKPREIHCRFVAATEWDVDAMLKQGTFRKALYARLSTFELKITGLKERPDDIPVIAKALGYEEEIPVDIYDMIFELNVRGIQRYIDRMKVYGEYN